MGLHDCAYTKKAADEDEEDLLYPTYVVHVPRSRIDKAYNALYEIDRALRNDFCVELSAIPPVLIPAEVGQLVRVYSTHRNDDDKSDVGIVVSKQQVVEKGETLTVYGCSYIQIALGSQFVSDITAFHMSGESYGGYHRGFLKIIDPSELPQILENMIAEGHRAALKKADSMLETARRDVGQFVKFLTSGTSASREQWFPPDKNADGYLSASVSLPEIRPNRNEGS